MKRAAGLFSRLILSNSARAGKPSRQSSSKAKILFAKVGLHVEIALDQRGAAVQFGCS